MDLLHYEPLNFPPYQSVSPETAKSFISAVKKDSGVFVVKKTGLNEIIHIGVGNGAKGLKERIRQIFSPGCSQSTNKKLHELLNDQGSIDITFAYTANPTFHCAALKRQLKL